MENNFECKYLSIGGDCMDNKDIDTWKECKGCKREDNCSYCTWKNSHEEGNCSKCTLKEN